MIKEAYVSFEIAKLLKEKGFDEKTMTYYEDEILCNGDWYEWNRSPLGHTAAPTHQMAMAWLREKCVYLEPYGSLNKKKDGVVYSCAIFQPSLCTGQIGCRYETDDFSQYDDAIEAALLYALENLI